MTSVNSLPPLVVDLDGTLIKTDCLFEALVKCFKIKPLTAVVVFLQILLGMRVRGKKKLATLAPLIPETLPYNLPLIDFLKQEKERGREVHMATATVMSEAKAIARHLGLFDSVQATVESNLKGERKAKLLREQFPGGFAYIGDSLADLTVWQSASEKMFAGNSRSGFRAFKRVRVKEGKLFKTDGLSAHVLFSQLRIHQWAKNLLMFVPLVLGHAFLTVTPWLITLAGFLTFSIFASATYVINDLLDLEADRQHATKKNRPLANGRLKISTSLLIALVLLIGGGASGFILSTEFGTLMLCYLIVTLSYSASLKRVPFLDCVLLGGLFTLRLIMGGALSGVGLTEWLLLFSTVFFFSLSVAKRYTEINRYSKPSRTHSDKLIPGRGFLGDDAPLVLGVGVASGFTALLILVLYLVENAFQTDLYAQPSWLWLIVVVLLLWILRIWILAQRGLLDDDPVSFAVRDKISLVLGAVVAISFFLAKFGVDVILLR